MTLVSIAVPCNIQLLQYPLPQAPDHKQIVQRINDIPYSLNCNKLPTISRAVMRVVAHRVGKSSVLVKVSA